jgi:hypothetical protein
MTKQAIVLSLVSAFFATIGFAAQSGQLMVYPERGQSPEQESQDKAACYTWAQNQLGYSPETLLQQAGTASQQNQAQTGQAVRGAGRGAAAGAIGGAIAGNAGKGAAIGAGVGGAAGASRRARAERQQEANQQQISAQVQQKLADFQKAQGTCLKGKGYSVG